MIKLDFVVDSGGCLRRVKARGHGKMNLDKGDPLCAAVSTLLNGALRWLQLVDGITVDKVMKKERGELAFEIGEVNEQQWPQLLGVSDFILTSFRDLAFLHKDRIKLNINGS